MFQLFVDGASRGNPGEASVGASLQNQKQEIASVSKSFGILTNNQAEYLALIEGLTLALHHTKEVHVYADSQLMIRQMIGQYRVKDEKLKVLFIQAQALAKQFTKCEFTHIPREQNKRADELANLALDS